LEVSTIIGVPRSYGYAVGPLPATLQTATSVAFLSTGQLVIVDSAHYTGGDPALLLATF
jgi:hypothetical protein